MFFTESSFTQFTAIHFLLIEIPIPDATLNTRINLRFSFNWSKTFELFQFMLILIISSRTLSHIVGSHVCQKLRPTGLIRFLSVLYGWKGSKMKKSSAVGGSKHILGDLLAIAIVFVALSAFNSTVLAVFGRWQTSVCSNYVVNYGLNFRSVKGNQITLAVANPYVLSASYVSLWQDLNNWYAVGYIRGLVPKNNTDGENGQVTFLSIPYYFVDHKLSGSYIFQYFTQAPVGAQQNHQYMVWLIHQVSGYNGMYAFVDGTTLQANLIGYTFAVCQASGQTETHDTRDQMNSHFLNMKAGPLWLNPVAFHDDGYYITPSTPGDPYDINSISDTEWTATGKGTY